MINKYNLNEKEITLKSDLAGEFPLYIYISEAKELLLYSTSIKELLNDKSVIKPLEVTSEGISFLLQSGVVPLPKTVYKNIFIISIGHSAVIKTINNKIDIEFSYDFPFFNENRGEESEVDEEYILEILAEATISKVQEDKPSYLFHSAGKDSNSIALALAEAGYQDRITSVSHQGKGEKDESEIAKQLAIKLGFKHEKIYEPKVLEQKDKDNINYYFENIPFPCMDTASLAYPLYTTQLEFNNSNIIDGMGNDVHIGHIPDRVEYNKQQYFSRLHHLRPLAGKLSSGSRLEIATSTRVEWVGLMGLTYGDTRELLTDATDVYNYWKEIDKQNSDRDYLDVRASIRGVSVDQEIFTRKVRNFSDITDSNLILPWASQKVAEYFSKLPEKHLFDREGLKNKLFLRKMLKDRLGLDSDKLGKMAYGFSFYNILLMMQKEVNYEMYTCKLWNEKGIENVLNNLYQKIENNHRSKERAKTLIQRIYLLSAWYNNNYYLRG